MERGAIEADSIRSAGHDDDVRGLISGGRAALQGGHGRDKDHSRHSSWSRIDLEKPQFHSPEHFGRVVFVD
ncbi:MAG: hypothetical protein GEU99_22165 [Luteitalea sp.]|nr:hypothetical protein [Luteitalea sp.]